MLSSLASSYNYYIVVILMMIGLYAVFASGNMVKRLVGLGVFQAAVFLFYITLGKVAGGQPPILPEKDKKADASYATVYDVGGVAEAPARLVLEVDASGVVSATEYDGASSDGASSPAPADEDRAPAVEAVSDASTDDTQGASGSPSEETVAVSPDLDGDMSADGGALVERDAPLGVVEAQAGDASPAQRAAVQANVVEPLTVSEASEGAPALGGAPTEGPVGRNGDAKAEVLYSNPLPHVLILTAIVVGVATLSVGLALVVRIRETYGSIEEADINLADHDVDVREAGA